MSQDVSLSEFSAQANNPGDIIGQRATSQTGWGLVQNQENVSINDLLNFRLLKDANPAKFGDLAKKETELLALSFDLLKGNPLLQMKMGGNNLNSANNLSKYLKNRAETLAIHHIIDDSAKAILEKSLSEDFGLRQNALDKIKQTVTYAPDATAPLTNPGAIVIAANSFLKTAP